MFFFLMFAFAILGLSWFHPPEWFLTLMFTDGLNWDFFLLEKTMRVEWKTMFTADLVSLAKELHYTPDVAQKEHCQKF